MALICTMQIHEHPITVRPTDIDAMKHVNNVVYVQWVQDAASAHWRAYAPKEIVMKYNWVVLRHEIDYRSAAVLHDKLSARTWVQRYEGAKSTRIVQIFRIEDNKLLAEATSTWCLLASDTNRPVRIADEIRNIFEAQGTSR